ncbi:MAG: aminotransferase class I/II-fold pyridoxal phosphate-dependent enzyme [Lachnospiraceae bacterium]|nr:aminotransferase class I/II-fold pyridoxal phosphate-dependent enzyme [Lachnospiraceae bacterium]
MSAFHGSDLEKIEEIYGIAKEEIISFAANVSPLGLSEGFIEHMGANLSCIERYPERDYRSLREAISGYCKTDYKDIIVGNGSSELIGAVIRYKKAPRAMIIAPAYSEYERDIKLAGGKVLYFDLKEENDFRLIPDELCDVLDESLDLLIICNPLNPTSKAVRADEMRGLLKRCEELDIICVVDETYVDFADMCYDMSGLTVEFKSLFVIRSMSKFFCAPGLRLGYALTSDTGLIKEIDSKRDPWSVSSFAEAAGAYMLSDEDYIRKVKKYISDERKRVCERLSELTGIKYYEPAANFVLVKLPADKITADRLFEAAIKEKMMIRDCSSFRGLDESFIRFCFMSKEDDDKLLNLMREVII